MLLWCVWERCKLVCEGDVLILCVWERCKLVCEGEV